MIGVPERSTDFTDMVTCVVAGGGDTELVVVYAVSDGLLVPIEFIADTRYV
ncbi:hypothetical protein DYY66_2601 [Candidatus Nitrosotalea sp. FS]|nr:hypothetical protein [Candidatus Nitrosotalea sp. FS]